MSRNKRQDWYDQGQAQTEGEKVRITNGVETTRWFDDYAQASRAWDLMFGVEKA